MPGLSAVLSNLRRDLDTCVECHSVLLEWKGLHDLLQDLEVPFETLVLDRVRGKALVDISPDLPYIQTGWDMCRGIITSRLIPFAEGIRHIGVRYREENGRPFGEEWIVDLVIEQRAIDEALDDQRIRSLREHISQLESALPKHLHVADGKLQDKKTHLKDLSERLGKTSSQIEALLADDAPRLSPLLEDLRELVQQQTRLLEWLELHGLFQGLHKRFGPIYIVGRKPERQLDGDDFDSITKLWRECQNTTLHDFFAFAKSVSRIGKVVEDEAGNLRGEDWAEELAWKQKRIAEALEEASPRLLQKAIILLHEAISRHFRIVNDKLKMTAEDLDRLTHQLRGRVWQ